MGFFDNFGSIVSGAGSALDTVSGITGQVQNLTTQLNNIGGSGGFSVPSVNWGPIMGMGGPATSGPFPTVQLPPEQFGPPEAPGTGNQTLLIVAAAAVAIFALR